MAFATAWSNSCLLVCVYVYVLSMCAANAYTKAVLMKVGNIKTYGLQGQETLYKNIH